MASTGETKGAEKAGKKGVPHKPTGLVYDDRCLAHPHSVELPGRLEAIRDALRKEGLFGSLTRIAAVADPRPHIRRVHTDEHIDGIDRIEITGEVAGIAVAGILGAVTAVREGTVRNAFCAIRPPGHHARNTGVEEGFCFYSNVAIAALYARHVCGYDRILIIDWDYHHGNGTQDVFAADPKTLFFSTHDWRAYPGTGNPRYAGEGAGRGYTINVHLDCGSDEYDMLEAWEKKLVPPLREFRPDIIFISAGFDCKSNDLLGCFRVSPAGFAAVTEKAVELADAYCGGRLVSVLEGGYADRVVDRGAAFSPFSGLAKSVVRHVGTLAGVRS